MPEMKTQIQMKVEGLPDRDERLRVVYDEALRGIAQQQDMLDELRDRTSRLMIVGAAGVAFTAFTGQTPQSALTAFAGGVALGAFLLTTLLAIAVQLPRAFTFRNDPHKLLTDWIDERDYSLDHCHRRLAHHIGRHYDENQPVIGQLQRLYRYGMWCLVVALVAVVVGGLL